MPLIALSEDGEGASPPSGEPSTSNAGSQGIVTESERKEEALTEPAAETLGSARDDEDARLVDVALLVDSPEKLQDVLETLLNKLHRTTEVVAEKHPGVSLRVAFISYRHFDQSLVADLAPFSKGIFDEPISIFQRQGSAEQLGQDVLRGWKEVPTVGWSARHRLLVQISDGSSPLSPDNDGDDGDRNMHAEKLQCLRDECGLQAYYFAYFNDHTQRLVSELEAGAAGEPGWFVSEKLDDADVLPDKIAELVAGVLDKAVGASALENGGSASPLRADPSELAAEADEPPTRGLRTPSQASQVTANMKIVTLPTSEVEGAQTPHRYRASSDDGMGPRHHDGSPKLEAEASSASTHKSSAGSRKSAAPGVGSGAAGSFRASGAGDAGAGAESLKSGSGGGRGSARPSEAGSIRSKVRSGVPSEVGAGGAVSVKSSPWSELGAGDDGLIKASRLSNPGSGPGIGGGSTRGSVPPSEAGLDGARGGSGGGSVKGSARSSEVGAASAVATSAKGSSRGSEVGAGGGTGSVKGSVRGSEVGAASAGGGSAKGSARPSEVGAGGAGRSGSRACSVVPEADEGRNTDAPTEAGGSEHGSRRSSPPSDPGAGADAPGDGASMKSAPPSEAGAKSAPPGSQKSSPPSEIGGKLAPPASHKSSPPSEAGAAGADSLGKEAPASEAGAAAAAAAEGGTGSPRSAGTPTPRPPPPAEISSSIGPPLPGILSAVTDFTGAPTAQHSTTTATAEAQRPPVFQPLPWSDRALEDYKSEMKKTSFELLDPTDEPLTARLDAVFSEPRELWPVLPPGALYCLEASDPRTTFKYLQHRDFPSTKVRVSTYFGKWCRHLVDYVVAWQPTPRAEAAWQLADGKQPPLPWEPRQVVAHTTNGEYQYANTRMRFRGHKSTKPDAEVVEYSDAHGVDLLDTKAAHESAPRNSDKDRDAHLIDPPRPNTWGELARRPLISNMRAKGGGAYVHHINYDNSGLRALCGRRVPAGYFFSLIPNAPAKTPAVPGGRNVRARPISAGRAIAAAREARNISFASVSAAVGSTVSLLRSVRAVSASASAEGPLRSSPTVEDSTAVCEDIAAGSSFVSAQASARQRPSSAGPRRNIRSGSFGAQVGPQSSYNSQLRGTLLGGASSVLQGPGTPSPTQVGWGRRAIANAASQEASGMTAASGSPTIVGLDGLVALTDNKARWRTYDVPFDHPLNSIRAAELGAEEARASGRNVRSFSDAAAVMKVAEQELRLSQPFVPGPLVVPKWKDIPRMYAEHMEAARALMPVTELDTYGSSTLHMLIYFLQCAATLEYDRLDAKLLLLPQMVRLGKKGAEVDAWLQAIVEHASFLYDKLEIYDQVQWAPLGDTPKPAAVQWDASLPAVQSSATTTGGGGALLTRASLTVLPPPPPTATAPGQSQGWVFPDPLKGTAHASRSAVNAAAQVRPSVREQSLPAQLVTQAEWSAIAGIMDPSRHKNLIDAWTRLRPLMTGAVRHGTGASAGRPGSLADDGSSDAAATATGFGDVKQASGTLTGPAAYDPYAHGNVNREVLDYLPKDLQAMASADFVPPPPAATVLPKHRGYRGDGPLPPELVADMPTVQRPVRCRGTDETPLPSTYTSMDIWNITTKAEVIPPRVGRVGEATDPRDAGATRSSQVAVQRLQAAREFAASQQAAIRKSMLLAKGVSPADESDVPYYGSDVAEDEFSTDIAGDAVKDSGTPRRRVGAAIRRSTGAEDATRRPGTATQTTSDLGLPTPEEEAEAWEKARAVAEAAEAKRRLLMKSSKSREQILEEALRSADAAIRSLQPRPLGSGIMTPPPDEPDSPRLLLVPDEPGDAELALAMRPPVLKHSHSEVMPFNWYKHTADPKQKQHGGQGQQEQQQQSARELQRTMSYASVYNPGGGGPEPFSLEKIWRDPNGGSDIDSGMDAMALGDLPSATGGRFYAEPSGFGGLVDYETAMARRRAIAGAEVVQLQTNFIPKSDVFNLLIVYCNLGRQPDQVELLQQAIEAPVSLRTVSATARAAAAIAAAAGPAAAAAANTGARRAATGRQEDMESEATRQRIKATAWLLGVTWRRISNETYSSFLSRVLGWPPEMAIAMHRTRATHIIARALVRGHDMSTVPKPPPRQ